MAYSPPGNASVGVPVPSGVNSGYDLPAGFLSFLDPLDPGWEEDLGQHSSVHTVPEPSPEPHVDEMDLGSILDSKPPVDVKFTYGPLRSPPQPTPPSPQPFSAL